MVSRIVSNHKYFKETEFVYLFLCKVEKILKGSLDSIPSPSLKIQIMGGKVYWLFNKILKTKGLLTSPTNGLHQVNFLANNLNFHVR